MVADELVSAVTPIEATRGEFVKPCSICLRDPAVRNIPNQNMVEAVKLSDRTDEATFREALQEVARVHVGS